MTDYELEAALGPAASVGGWSGALALPRKLFIAPGPVDPEEARAASLRGPVACLSVHRFAGIGAERATLWNGGEAELRDASVDAVLRALGVGEGDDGLEALGLLAHRTTLGWRAQARIESLLRNGPPLRGLVSALGFKGEDGLLEEEVRVQAAGRLGKEGRVARPALPSLLDALRSDARPRVARACACAMARIGAEGIPMLLGALEDPTGPDGGTIVYALGEAGDEARSCIPALQRRLREGASPFLRARSAEVLGRLDPDGSANVLLAALSDPSPFVRCRAAEALGRGFDLYIEHIEALRSALADEDPYVRGAASDALHRLEARY
jgi:hypothetical protein